MTRVAIGGITSGVGDGHAIFGDSGGPQLDASGNQVGVCSGGQPGINQTYISVATHLDWIRTQAGL